MSDFVDTLIIRRCVEKLKLLNIKRERCFVGVDLGREERRDLIEELKSYNYEDRKSRRSGALQKSSR